MSCARAADCQTTAPAFVLWSFVARPCHLKSLLAWQNCRCRWLSGFRSLIAMRRRRSWQSAFAPPTLTKQCRSRPSSPQAPLAFCNLGKFARLRHFGCLLDPDRIIPEFAPKNGWCRKTCSSSSSRCPRRTGGCSQKRPPLSSRYGGYLHPAQRPCL